MDVTRPEHQLNRPQHTRQIKHPKGTEVNLDLPIIRWSTESAAQRLRVLTRGGHADDLGSNPGLRADMEAIIAAVRVLGDGALVNALARFDKMTVTPDQLRVSPDEIATARDSVAPPLLEAIRTSIGQVRAFNTLVRDRASWTTITDRGAVVGMSAAPIPSVGLFVPSGKGSFPSVAIQIAAPAVVAGVPRIAVVVPPVPGGDGAIDPVTLAALATLGITEIYRSNGPAGIAALALGTQTIAKVKKIVGPGSPAVTLTQMLVQQFGTAVALGFGPTDSAIIADSTANTELLAADVLNEAEHGMDSSAILISAEEAILQATAAAIARQIEALPEPRRTYAARSIGENGGLILVDDIEAALEVANAYASEHLQLAVADPQAVLAGVLYAGTVLLGQTTSFAMSNFATGSPATLPTTGFAQVSDGVTAETYLVKSAISGIDAAEFERLAPTVIALAEHEGFSAHVASTKIRRDR